MPIPANRSRACASSVASQIGATGETGTGDRTATTVGSKGTGTRRMALVKANISPACTVTGLALRLVRTDAVPRVTWSHAVLSATYSTAKRASVNVISV